MQFCLPDLGEGIVDAELVQWMVQPGDLVAHGQNIAEVMTDKATVELPSPFTGTITAMLAEPGQQIKVGQAMLDYQATDATRAPESQTAVAKTEQPTQPPAMAPVRPLTVPSPPLSRCAGAGEGTFESATRRGPTQSDDVPAGSVSDSAGAVLSPGAVMAAPAVRRMAERLEIDLRDVPGSGPQHRVLIDDLAAFIKQSGRPSDSVRPGGQQESSSSQAAEQPGSRIKLCGLRRTIAQRMTHACQTIPQYSYVDECDVSELVRLRESLKDRFADAGIRLTYLPFFVKALVAALQEIPLANATLDQQADEIVLHDHYHIGIATDTPGGLVVPVLREVDCKTLPQIAHEIQQLAEASRNGLTVPNQMRGSTFTITSTGGLGGLISTPIINEPAVGILGIGRVVKRPVYDDAGDLRAAHIVYLSFTFDHRVVDGAVAARLSNALIARLKKPAVMLLPNQFDSVACQCSTDSA